MIQIKTPKGTASDLYLVQPDTKFGPKGTYKVDIRLDTGEGALMIKACREEAVQGLGIKKGAKVRMPWVENGDGTVTFRFRSRSRPSVYDSRANLLAPEALEHLRIGTGSTIRVNGEASVYEGFGGGVLLLMHEVQIIHLVGRFEPDPSGSFVAEDSRLLNR